MFQVVSVYRQRGRLLAALAALLVLCGTAEAVRSPTAMTVDTAPEGVRVPIVMYHGLLPEKGRQGPYVIDPALFESDLQYLQAAGYETVTVADLLRYVQEGKALPEKPVMLTFDDGYYNNYLYALPLLKQYGMKAVLAPIGVVSAFYSDNPREQNHERYSHATWEQLREMVDSGCWEIQSHSYDLHHNEKGERHGASKLKGESTATYQAMLKTDVATANQLLKEKVGVTPTAFVYPFGAAHKDARPVLEALGFAATFSCEERVSTVTRDPESLWWLGRYRRPHDKSSAAFFAAVLGEENSHGGQ